MHIELVIALHISNAKSIDNKFDTILRQYYYFICTNVKNVTIN